jgi:hypothetical protein
VALQPPLGYYGYPFNPVQFRKDGDGVVWLRGMVKGATSGSVIFTLPTGYCPAYQQLHGVCISPNVIGRVDVCQDGRVLLQVGSNDWVSLDGIAFRASPLASNVTTSQHW